MAKRQKRKAKDKDDEKTRGRRAVAQSRAAAAAYRDEDGGRVLHSGAADGAGSSGSSGYSGLADPAPASGHQPPGAAPVRTGELKRSRVRRRWLIVGIVVLILAALAALVRFVPIFTVSSFTVKGNSNTTSEEIVEKSGLHKGDNMAAIDTAAAAQSVVSLPWVTEATVARSWPKTVTITVKEATVAFYVDDGGDRLFDTDGHEFIQTPHPENTLKLSGSVPSDEVAHAVATVARSVEKKIPDKLADIDCIEAPNENNISLVFKDGRTVKWGTADNADSKAEATRVVLQREGKNWDVSNPTQVTVKN